MKIRDLLKRDLTHKIEEIIQLGQTEESAVYEELNEYVATGSIRRQYRDLLEAMSAARLEPTEGIGVWISGFFGSGKSSFAKNLGYVLANEKVLGYRAADLFKERVDDPDVSDLVDVLNANMPAEVIMFDVQKDVASQTVSDISPVVYRVLLRHLGYAEDFDVAELEISLEESGELNDFIDRFDRRYAGEKPQLAWEKRGRMGARNLSNASAILHEMDPATYPAADSYVNSVRGGWVEPTPRMLVERTFELMERRRPGRTPVFIVDEVGQYVASHQGRLENLRAVVEELGKEGRNRLRQKRIPAQPWFVVTSQERLDEVTSALGDDRRVLLAKVRDRFKHEVDLSPADVREVAARRVLSKNDEGEKELRSLFEGNEGRVNASCRLESRSRESEVTEKEFVEFYPYLPHYMDLSIDIMSGIRLQEGATRHIGGSNRTIISQVYEMLVNDRTAFADKEPGALVSLDRIYDLIEGQMGESKRRDIAQISARFANEPEDAGYSARVAKAIALLEVVKDLPRTPENIAALLVDRVDVASPLPEVEAALSRLVDAQFARDTGEGYKLQTEQEKSWEEEKKGHKDPRPKERNEIKRELLEEILGETSLRKYRYRDLHTFSVGVIVDGAKLGGEGRIPLSVLTADDESERGGKVEEARGESRRNRDTIYWVFNLTDEIHSLVAAYHASNRMVSTYQQQQSQNKISKEDASSLAEERTEQRRLKGRLTEKMSAALAGGQGFFHGAPRDASDLGRTPAEIFRSLFDLAVPDLYTKLPLGSAKLSGKEAEEILSASDLKGLSSVFYEGEEGLGLVVQEGASYVPNLNAEIAREVLDHLNNEHSYGNKVTGKDLEARFGGMPYGWDQDVLKLVLATLLRGDGIEATHQGRRHRDHTDPQARVPFTNNPAFRNASFAPREAIDLKTLTAAVEQYENLTGTTVNVDTGEISEAFKELAGSELEELSSALSQAMAHGLAVAEELEEYRADLQEVRNDDHEDAVRKLVGEGNSMRETREKVRRIKAAVTPENLELLRRSRTVLNEMWPPLEARAEDEGLSESAADLERALSNPAFHEELTNISKLSAEIESAYRELYARVHEQRRREFSQAAEEVRQRPEWNELPEETATPELSPLTRKICGPVDLPEGETRCPSCRATVGEMEAELAAISSLRSRVVSRVIELAAPPETEAVERVRLSAFFDGSLDSPEEVDAAVGRLSDHLHRLVADGKTVVLE